MNENDSKNFLQGENALYIESLYESFLKNPTSVSVEWQTYFNQFDNTNVPLHSTVREEFLQLGLHKKSQNKVAEQREITNAKELAALLLHERKQTRVLELINAHRLLGHLYSEIDPLNFRERLSVPELELIYYGLSEDDFETVFEVGNFGTQAKRTLKQLLIELNTIYCGHIASEFMHVTNSSERWWVQTQVETRLINPSLSLTEKGIILRALTQAEGLEKYLGAKYPGAKRFSLEGSDSLIVLLEKIIDLSGVQGSKEVVIGMAHRGRLNVLVNILGKYPSQLFNEFEDKIDEVEASGDVKYHQGFSSNVRTSGGIVHLSLAFNPSHLEIVAPVVAGSVKARLQRHNQGRQYNEVVPILIHGDASFSGQGVIMETLNMSQTRGYTIGGAIHIIVNNQIGFTTSDPKDARSTLYCSDAAKMIQAPIFHVNADDPEACYVIAQLAFEYRAKFNKDVFIDLVSYRRHGHNEADEPAATQPNMYLKIRQQATVLNIYAKALIAQQLMTQMQIDELALNFRKLLDEAKESGANNLVKDWKGNFTVDWSPYFNKDWRDSPSTQVDSKIIETLYTRLEQLPENLKLHPRVAKIMDDRRKMSQGLLPLDWGYAETMAYATLLNEGHMVRLAGQDTGRGTFFHRHAVLHNQVDHFTYTPLCHLNEGQGSFYVIDTLLSELAVLGFEYGFAASEPRGLVIWEAQFGDFANGAQIVIDQFISSGEQKWRRLCGLTLLLPHGYEGMGPEHSSARLERFLQLCAENNMQVCVPSTPAQIFHLLRRQVLRWMRKPLIIMSPKSLLRHPLAVSKLEELSNGKFQLLIQETDQTIEIDKVKRVILCSGKVYYDLIEARLKEKRTNVSVIRIEQLYPFPDKELLEVLAEYKEDASIVWCQEEPQNQGAWDYIQPYLKNCLKEKQHLSYAGRQAAAAPASGYHHLHQLQLEAFIREALGQP
ncbi:MAG: 2-oxoglutarate dehydrogenase subunit [Francisellaceae bacterium]|nr:2-oxoglutarate dehydrogenase subunit [Francisellaceae bacterium]